MKNHFKRTSLKRRSGSLTSTPTTAAVGVARYVGTRAGTIGTPGDSGSPQEPPDVVEPAWSNLYMEHCEDAGVLESLRGAHGGLSVDGFVRMWAAALGDDKTAPSPDTSELSKIFRIVLDPNADGLCSKEEFDLLAPGLWRCRLEFGGLLANLAAVDAETINQLLPPHAKPVPKHMLQMLFTQFTTEGGGAHQFSRLYAAVARQYQTSGALPDDIMEAYDVIVLAGASDDQLQESTFVKRFNILWQRQGDVGVLSRIVRAALAPEPASRGSVSRINKFDAAGPGFGARRKGRASVAESERGSIKAASGHNPMATARISLTGSPGPSPVASRMSLKGASAPSPVTRSPLTNNARERYDRQDKDDYPKKNVKVAASPDKRDSGPKLRGGAPSNKASRWDDESDHETPGVTLAKQLRSPEKRDSGPKLRGGAPSNNASRWDDESDDETPSVTVGKQPRSPEKRDSGPKLRGGAPKSKASPWEDSDDETPGVTVGKQPGKKARPPANRASPWDDDSEDENPVVTNGKQPQRRAVTKQKKANDSNSSPSDDVQPKSKPSSRAKAKGRSASAPKRDDAADDASSQDDESDGNVQQKLRTAAKAKAKGRAASAPLRGDASDEDAHRKAKPRSGMLTGKALNSPWDDVSDGHDSPKPKAKQKTRPKNSRPSSAPDVDDSDDDHVERTYVKPRLKATASTTSAAGDAAHSDGDVQPKSKQSSRANAKRRSASAPKRDDLSEDEEPKPNLKAKAKGRSASAPKRADVSDDDASSKAKTKGRSAAALKRDDVSDDDTSSKISAAAGENTPRGTRRRSSYAEERRLARARAKAGLRPNAPEADAAEFSKPVQADELPEDDGGQWGAVRGDLRFVQWTGTAQWAESLDDTAGRAVGASVAQLAAERSLDATGASERRLRALMEGPHAHKPAARMNSPISSARGIRDVEVAMQPPSVASVQLVTPYSPRTHSPGRDAAPVALTMSPSRNAMKTTSGRVLAPAMGAVSPRSPVRDTRSPVRRHSPLRRPEGTSIPSLPTESQQALWDRRGVERGAELNKDPSVFREMLCIGDEPSAHWIADEMMATLLPSNIHPLDPQSRDPLVLRALSECAPEVPALLYVSLAGDSPEVLLRHPYQEVFDQVVALASLMEKSTSPQVLVDAAEEAWTSQYNTAVMDWREERLIGGTAEFVNSETGERSATDPRQHLLRELQLGCRLMAMLRARW